MINNIYSNNKQIKAVQSVRRNIQLTANSRPHFKLSQLIRDEFPKIDKVFAFLPIECACLLPTFA